VCYTCVAIIVIGLIKKNSNLILSQVIILAIPDAIWIVDFLSVAFFGHDLTGLTNYFQSQPVLYKLVSLQHFYTVPLSLIALSFLKIKRNYKVLLFSLAELVFFFLISSFLVFDKVDVNCVRLTCLTINLHFLPSYIIWFMFSFGFTIISYFLITSIPFFKKKI
jgi:hypothetical protein